MFITIEKSVRIFHNGFHNIERKKKHAKSLHNEGYQTLLLEIDTTYGFKSR